MTRFGNLNCSSRITKDSLLLALILLIVAVVNHDIYQIPFHGDELEGLLGNRNIRSFQFFADHLLTLRGMLHRPLSQLTFTLNYYLSAKDVWSYHLINLLIHLINVCLVYKVSRKLQIVPWVSALVFGLHPLTTACVSQVFGRPYSLGTLFFLLALLLFLERGGSDRLKSIDYYYLFTFWMFAILSKQVFIVLPLLFIWIAFCRGGSVRAILGDVLKNAPLLASLVLIASVAFVFGYALPYSATASVGPKTFFLSQVGNLPLVIVEMYLLPLRLALNHSLPWYTEVIQGPVMLGFLLLPVLLILVYRYRHQPALMLIGCMFIMLIPTNSVFPKNEVVLEWRLYPSLVFYSLFIASLFSIGCANCEQHLSKSRKYRIVCFCVGIFCPMIYVGYLGIRTNEQNDVYSSPITTYRQVVAQYPNGVIALSNLGYVLTQSGHYADAEIYLIKAKRLSPDYLKAAENLVYLYQVNGSKKKWKEAEKARLSLLAKRAAAKKGAGQNKR